MEKDLLLKDLCARLPYGVKVKFKFQPDKEKEFESIGTLEAINLYDVEIDCEKLHGRPISLNEIKPYLFPLSSMTEEQFKEMQEIIGNPNEACISVNTSGLELWLNSVDTDPTIWLDTVFELQDWLNKNHFDYRGLIEKSLAIDCTNLNIY